MKQIVIYLFLLLVCNNGVAQNDFTGIVKYKLSVLGSTDTNTDSMSVIFDKDRVMIILYLPDGNKISEKIFVDNFKERKSYRIDPEKKEYQVDTLKAATGYEFINDNSIGAVNNELCIRYKADLNGRDKSDVFAAECLAAINYRNSFIKNYSFLGVQPVIVDNRIVMDFVVNRTNGTRPDITVYNIRKIENVTEYFSLDGYTEIK